MSDTKEGKGKFLAGITLGSVITGGTAVVVWIAGIFQDKARTGIEWFAAAIATSAIWLWWDRLLVAIVAGGIAAFIAWKIAQGRKQREYVANVKQYGERRDKEQEAAIKQARLAGIRVTIEATVKRPSIDATPRLTLWVVLLGGRVMTPPITAFRATLIMGDWRENVDYPSPGFSLTGGGEDSCFEVSKEIPEALLEHWERGHSLRNLPEMDIEGLQIITPERTYYGPVATRIVVRGWHHLPDPTALSVVMAKEARAAASRQPPRATNS